MIDAPLDPKQIARLLGPQPTWAPVPPAKKLSNGVLFHKPLADDAVRDIRKRWGKGEPIKLIAADHGITKAAVSLIGSGQRRKDVI